MSTDAGDVEITGGFAMIRFHRVVGREAVVGMKRSVFKKEPRKKKTEAASRDSSFEESFVLL